MSSVSSSSSSSSRRRRSQLSGQLSIERPDAPEVAGEGKPRRHPLIASSGPEGFISTYDDSVTTVYESFQHSVRRFAPNDFLGTRRMENGEAKEYVFETYGHVAKRVNDLAAGMSQLGLTEKSNIGIFSINRAEWIIAEHACFTNNYVTVPLYDTLGDDAIEHICSQTEMKLAVVSIQKIPSLLKLKEKLSYLETIICMDNAIPDNIKGEAESKGVKILKYGDVEEQGRSVEDFKPTPPKAEDLCTICYSSGTTGIPKGVMLTHRSLLAVCSASLTLLSHNPKYPNPNPICELDCPGEVYLSYLPLAHVMERAIITTLSTLGFKFGFYQGDLMKLLSDCEALKPTFFVSVPRLFNRVHDKVKAGVEAKGGMAKWLFEYAFESKLEALHKNGDLKHWLWDRVVFSAIREKLGGRVKAMLTGSAPLSAQVIDFLRVVFSCPVIEGFGMTETAAITTLTSPGDLTQGQIGLPVSCVEIKLVDIPEMSYTSKDKPNPRGEIWIRGPSVFSGYYKDEVNTNAAFKDGWVVTGDVGMWDSQGRLFLIDRKKSLFKLAQGEYVAPEKIEAIICRNNKVAQAYIEGNSLRSFLVAIIVPDKETVLPWAQEAFGLSSDLSWPDVCTNDQVIQGILKEISSLGSKGTGELKGFEVPRAIHLEPELFSVESGLVTPTFKLKRPFAKKHYSEIIENLYNSVKE